MKKNFYYLSLLVGFVFGLACFTSCCDTDDVTSGGETTFYLDDDALPAGVIDPTTGAIQLAEGSELTLPFVVEPAELASQIVLSSSNPAVVEVNGLKLIAKNPGLATIYATAGRYTMQYDVEVKAGRPINIVLDGNQMPRGSYDPATRTITLAEGGDLTLPFIVEPEALASELRLASANTDIVSVDGLKITGVKAGETKIFATIGNKIVEYNVKVEKTPIDLSELTGDYILQNGDVLTGTLNGNYKITIADGATITLDNATINGVNSSDYNWAGLTPLGDVTIILKDGTTSIVKGFYENYPGIYVPVGKKLTIKGETLGTGKLYASSNGLGAGIGGGYNISCGNIVIAGGNITANGGSNAAGIGGGAADSDVAHCGDITITGGTVTAKGGTYGAGIGTGFNNLTEYSASCGNITITGGTIDATGGSSSAGIGNGAGQSQSKKTKCGNIAIGNTVTKVTAKKGEYTPNSIGTGVLGDCGTVTIGGTKYWENNVYVGDGETYLTQSLIIYPTPTIGNVYVEPFKGEDDPLATK